MVSTDIDICIFVELRSRPDILSGKPNLSCVSAKQKLQGKTKKERSVGCLLRMIQELLLRYWKHSECPPAHLIPARTTPTQDALGTTPRRTVMARLRPAMTNIAIPQMRQATVHKLYMSTTWRMIQLELVLATPIILNISMTSRRRRATGQRRSCFSIS